MCLKYSLFCRSHPGGTFSPGGSDEEIHFYIKNHVALLGSRINQVQVSQVTERVREAWRLPDVPCHPGLCAAGMWPTQAGPSLEALRVTNRKALVIAHLAQLPEMVIF